MSMGSGKRENMDHEQDRWVARRALCEFVYTLRVHVCFLYDAVQVNPLDGHVCSLCEGV